MWPAMTSRRAVTVAFVDAGTRGVQPRISWAVRRDDTMTNSNAFRVFWSSTWTPAENTDESRGLGIDSAQVAGGRLGRSARARGGHCSNAGGRQQKLT